MLLGVLLVAIADFVFGSLIRPSETKKAQGFVGYQGKSCSGHNAIMRI